MSRIANMMSARFGQSSGSETKEQPKSVSSALSSMFESLFNKPYYKQPGYYDYDPTLGYMLRLDEGGPNGRKFDDPSLNRERFEQRQQILAEATMRMFSEEYMNQPSFQANQAWQQILAMYGRRGQ